VIGISKLLLDKTEPSDELRYGGSATPAARLRPVVVYNCTRRCNLRCVHCYADAAPRGDPDELATDEARRMIDSIAEFGCLALLLSGGEPLLRHDVLELIAHATSRGLRTTLSTNGTNITRDVARKLKEFDLGYVGVSIDGTRETHDGFRRSPGSFDRALSGIGNCRAEGLRTGLRFTLTRRNYEQIPEIFRLIAERGIPRVCFYHLVYTGQGAGMASEDLSAPEARRAMDMIIAGTLDLHERGLPREVLTVDNHADGVYLWLWAREHLPGSAERILRLVKKNRARSTGEGIACVSWEGDVFPDQFWRDKVLGNVRQRSFGEIWTDAGNVFLADLRRREELVGGRCRRCRYLALCRGGFRSRAEAASGDMWAEDPACYLSDEEIAR
jgi:radical SAM protein with 4Fe4S-binding SPASM domain